jgi:hypothetical protein
MNSLTYRSLLKKVFLLLDRALLSSRFSNLSKDQCTISVQVARGSINQFPNDELYARRYLLKQVKGVESILYIESTPIHEEFFGCLTPGSSSNRIHPLPDYYNQEIQIGEIL